MGLMGLLLRGVALSGVALLLIWVLRRASASTRHQLRALTILALLVLPLLCLILPEWASPTEAEGTVTPTTAPSGLSALVLGYVAVAGLLLLRLAICLAGALRLIHTAQPAPQVLQAQLAPLAHPLGIRKPVRLAVTAGVPVPMTAAQTILLPPDALHWSAARLDSVFRHELAHIRRRDWLLLALAELTVALHWANPLVWVLLKSLRAEAELAADDLVLTSGVAPADYASHLLEVAALVRADATVS